jgi:hypothetical protein
MNLKSRRPSPAMVVALIALVLATTGSALAAVNFATNAGAVDGKSAVASGATLSRAAGKLVATQRHGSHRGQIATKYLDLKGLPLGATFGRAFDVVDNAAGAPVGIGGIPGIGTLTATCTDQRPQVGLEDPQTTIAFANTSGDGVNLSRTVGNGVPLIAPLPNGAQSAFTINGSNTFALHIEHKGTNYLAQGVVRQDGRGTPAASCLVYGFALAVSS